MHHSTRPTTRRWDADALEGLANLVAAMGNEPSISFMVIDDELIYDGSSLGNDIYLTRFAQVLAAHGIGSVQIARSSISGKWRPLFLAWRKRATAAKRSVLPKIFVWEKLRFGTAQPGDPGLNSLYSSSGPYNPGCQFRRNGQGHGSL